MTIIIYIYFFLIGLVFGSFFNVVGLRVPVGKSIVKPRSACPYCHHTLTAYELIPVVSFLMQKGKCRNCQAQISFIYPLFELLTGFLFMFSFLRFQFTGELMISLTLISLLIIITVTDLEYMLIPDKILLFFAPIFIAERIWMPLEPWWNAILGAFVGFALLLFIAMISQGGMGGGDIKLFALLGFIFGWKLLLLAFFLSTLFGAFFGLIGMITNKVQRGKPMPFGPYIAMGALITNFFGERIMEWYSMHFLHGWI